MVILEKILSKPIENLARSNKFPPQRDVLLLYRKYVKFANYLNWYNTDGTSWYEICRRQIIRTSIRVEIEESNQETDPLKRA